MGEGDNVAARGRGDAASGRVEGRTLKERLIARMNPSYAHRLPSGRFIPGWCRHASGTRYTMRWTSGQIAGAVRAATSEGRQQLQLTFSLVPRDQREEPGFATLDYREPFAVGEAVPRAVVDMCDRSARARECQQERARLTAEHLTIRIQHVRWPPRTKDEIVRNGAGIDCHWSGFVGGPAFAVQLHSERCRESVRRIDGSSPWRAFSVCVEPLDSQNIVTICCGVGHALDDGMMRGLRCRRARLGRSRDTGRSAHFPDISIRIALEF